MIWKSHLCFLKKLFSLSEKTEFKGGCARKKKGKLGHHFYYSVLFSSHCCWGALYPLWWKRNSVFLLAKSWWWPAGVENVGIGQVGCAGHDWRGSRKKMGVWLQREVRQGWCSPPTVILWHPGESIAKRRERGIDEWNLQAGMELELWRRETQSYWVRKNRVRWRMIEEREKMGVRVLILSVLAAGGIFVCTRNCVKWSTHCSLSRPQWKVLSIHILSKSFPRSFVHSCPQTQSTAQRCSA